MAYPIEEANTLLSDKLNAANENIEQLGQDIGFLREQITTVEVTMARIYNYTVKQRKSLNLTATA